MYTISKEFHFSASHILHGLPEGHPCGRLHGHNYRVELRVRGAELDGRGFILDYGDMSNFGDFIDTYLDHVHLNDVYADSPTAEYLARMLYLEAIELFPEVTIDSVLVSETPKVWATYGR